MVVEDHPLYRDALARAVTAARDVRLVATVDSVEALEEHLVVPPDVILLDLHLPGIPGAAAIRGLVARGAQVIVLTATVGRREVVAAFESGATGFLTKDADATAIVEAVRAVVAGGTVVAPAAASYVVQAMRHDTRPALSAREREVLSHVAGGNTDQEIARLMMISVRTVRSHLDRIRSKTGARRRAELARIAFEQELERGPFR